MVDVPSIISRWPNAETFAADLGLKHLSYGRVMKLRRSIPPAHWPAALKAAEVRGIPLSQQELEDAHRPSPSQEDGRAA